MSDVAAAAGVARATVYRYFPTREALLEALTGATVEQTGDALADARLPEVEIGEAFVRAVRTLVNVGDAFVVVARAAGRSELPGWSERVAIPLRDLIQRGQDAGEIRDDVPAAWLLESLLSLVAGVLGAAPRLGTEDTVRGIATLFLDGARGQ